jgi:hypothetical protein
VPPPRPALALAVNTTDLSIRVDTANFPGVSGSMIRVDQEVMRVIDVFGSAMTVMRGIDGTRVESHAVGSAVQVSGPVIPKPKPPWPTRFEREWVI